MTEKYIQYIKSVRRYSQRTCEIYSSVLREFFEYSSPDGSEDVALLNTTALRNYEVHLMDDKKENPRTVHLHLSVISGFCKYLVRLGELEGNPVRTVSRPKLEKKLPEFYREDSIESYFEQTKGVPEYGSYESSLNRLIVSLLYSSGLRRSELIALNIDSFDESRRVMNVVGKGDKMRKIPLTASICDEISLYLRKLRSLECCESSLDAPLLQTPKGGRLYPVFVDRVIKKELGGVAGITGRKSPHVLRHTIATELLDNGADLNSIKELLGHSSLAATQVYTHNTIERLQSVYRTAHPRAKNGGKNGD